MSITNLAWKMYHYFSMYLQIELDSLAPLHFQVPTKDYCVVLRCVALLRSINVLWFLIICFEVLCILFQGTHDLWFPSINIAMAIDIFKVLCIVAKYTCSLISLWFLSINKCLVLLFFAHSSSIYCSLVIKDIFRNQILQ